MDYEKTYKRLVDQINTEYNWSLQNSDDPEFKDRRELVRGMKMAYESLLEFIADIEKTEYRFEEKES